MGDKFVTFIGTQQSGQLFRDTFILLIYQGLSKNQTEL